MKLQLSFLFLGLLFAVSSFANMDCARALEKSEAYFRPGAKDIFLSFRENAPHYWKWMSENAEQTLDQELLIEGIVVGDPHLLNFGHVRLNSTSRFKIDVIDLDDSGRGSLILDLIRLNVGIQLSSASLSSEKILEAYRKGLKNEDFPLPKIIQEANGITLEEFNKNQERWLDKKTRNGRFNQKEIDGFRELRDAPQWLSESHQELVQKFDHKILDAGWISRVQGGSQGMVRIWLLTDSNSIFELKQMSVPATSHYSQQLGHSIRIQEVKSAYLGGVRTSQYGVHSTKHADYIFREKFDYELNDKIKDLLKSKSDRLNAYAEYVAYRLGELHSAQPAGKKLAQVIEKSSKDVQEKIKKISKKYQEELQNLFKGKGKK